MRRELILSLRNGISDSACEIETLCRSCTRARVRARARAMQMRGRQVFSSYVFLLAVPSRVAVAVDAIIT